MRVALILLPFLILSCGPDFLLNESKTISTEAWSYNDTISFGVEITDIQKVYDLNLIIDHSMEYGFENLYMKIHTGFPTIARRSEQLTVQLADKKGNWIGKCGKSCKVKVFLLEGFKFPEEGRYDFTFEQFTREENLLGINAFNLQIIPRKETQ